MASEGNLTLLGVTLLTLHRSDRPQRVGSPAGLVEWIDSTEKKVYVDRTKNQIKDAPRYDQAVADHVDYWERLGSYYSGTYMPPGGQM
ncbi:MAG TPA: hypothetical protein VI030_03285 [Propionibacteriaceae bacterium]